MKEIRPIPCKNTRLLQGSLFGALIRPIHRVMDHQPERSTRTSAPIAGRKRLQRREQSGERQVIVSFPSVSDGREATTKPMSFSLNGAPTGPGPLSVTFEGEGSDEPPRSGGGGPSRSNWGECDMFRRPKIS